MCLLIDKNDKGRILLPSEIRKAEKLKEGDEFAVD
jgi:bifunctional DNA-binding transcriptional regulator/antitoxin component of YhaV-PrlF toxin-antitoxin module